MSSIESAPATIPPTSAVTFNPAFAPKYPGKFSYLPANSPRPVDTAHIIAGMSPAADRRFVSLNAADKDADLWKVAPARPLFFRDELDCGTDNFPRPDRHSLFKTPPAPQPASVDLGSGTGVSKGSDPEPIRIHRGECCCPRPGRRHLHWSVCGPYLTGHLELSTRQIGSLHSSRRLFRCSRRSRPGDLSRTLQDDPPLYKWQWQNQVAPFPHRAPPHRRTEKHPELYWCGLRRETRVPTCLGSPCF